MNKINSNLQTPNGVCPNPTIPNEYYLGYV